MRGHIGPIRALAAVLVVGALVSGCPRRDEAKEQVICDELSQRLCDKWFDCWPVVSTELWDDTETCVDVVKPTCASGDELYECDMDNDDLEDCNDKIEGSACGDMPASCVDLVECSG